MSYDVVVLGGGPGGYVAAIKAAQMGKNTCIIERGAFGGTCLNVGCIPTKALLKSVEILNEVKHSEKYGVVNAEVNDAYLDMSKVQNRKQTVVNQLVAGVGGLLKKNKVTVVKGEGVFLDKNTIQVGDQKIVGDNIIIATGSSPKFLPIDIDPAMPVYTSTEILSMEDFPAEMAIIGGGVIGVELAYYLANVGVKVKIIEFLDRILPMVDQEITDLVTKQFLEMGISIHTGAKVTKIGKGTVLFEKGGVVESEDCSAVLMAVGRQANIEGLNLEGIGVKTQRGAVACDEYLKTNIPGIYAVGDVNGKLMLAHTASMEGIVAVENICGYKKTMDYEKIPSAIYIKPEIASIGLTEEQAREKYGKIKVGKFPMMANGKAKIEGEDRGVVKIIAEARYGEIVGAHLYCVHATDMIAEFSVALHLECTAEEIAASVHPHPTISEAVHEASHGVLHKTIHF